MQSCSGEVESGSGSPISPLMLMKLQAAYPFNSGVSLVKELAKRVVV